MKAGSSFDKSEHEGLPARQAATEAMIAAPRVCGLSAPAPAGSNPRNLALNEVLVQPMYFPAVVFGPTAVLTLAHPFPRGIISVSALATGKPMIITAISLSTVTLQTSDGSSNTEDVYLCAWGY